MRVEKLYVITEECPCCEGRCGFGRSSNGVTLSWTACGECAGEGVIYTEVPLDNEDGEYILVFK